MNPVHVGLYIILFVIVVGLAVTNPKLKGFMPTRKIPMYMAAKLVFFSRTPGTISLQVAHRYFPRLSSDSPD